MSKNEDTTNELINTTAIRRLPSFDPTLKRPNIITKQLFTLTPPNHDEQEESELSGDDKRCNPSYCELL
ncbi:hypothetical protein RAS_09760 [Rickettsia asiatica]|uniref:Uncharacterized protein n=1 Tax=Rickettsia asiatica TaxID=238800 RepID=A0A510GH80_9RICK|nr:hypothetical protein [Rickettsia asiatica]BBJ31867.1 hypothetical protein RAS_09760 [Rickettsia asiatica]